MWITISPEPIECTADFDVVAESDDWIVVDKPAPLIVHPANNKNEPNLLEGVSSLLCFEMETGGMLGLINRLDRETSGLSLVAKNVSMARELGKAMQRHEIHKQYYALVYGSPDWLEYDCQLPIIRKGEITHSDIYVKQIVHTQGKPCHTQFTRLRSFDTTKGLFSLIKCQPITGRMHQIRVHLAELGHPIVGDKIYGPNENHYLDFIQHGWSAEMESDLILRRQALHAYKLSFPYEEETITLEIGLPKDIRSFLDAHLITKKGIE